MMGSEMSGSAFNAEKSSVGHNERNDKRFGQLLAIKAAINLGALHVAIRTFIYTATVVLHYLCRNY
jgi:hypothetical protein